DWDSTADQDEPRGRRDESRYQVEQRALAGAARAEDRNELARRNAEAHLRDRRDRLGAAVVVLAHFFESDCDVLHHPSYSCRSARPGSSRPARRAGSMAASPATATVSAASTASGAKARPTCSA